MGNGNFALFVGVLELMMITFDMVQYPSILLKPFDNLSTTHILPARYANSLID